MPQKPPEPIDVIFRGGPTELLKEPQLHQLCLELSDIVKKATKASARIAEKHQVSLKVDLIFDLNP